jgi:UDP-2,3-diacylglucosamine hydrolase
VQSTIRPIHTPRISITCRNMAKFDYIVSDLHLGAVPEATERAFIAFLRTIAPTAKSLLINGDLFDFWFEWGDVIPSEHYRVLAAIADLVDAGIRVTMLGGNHDAWGGRFLREHVGIVLHDGVVRTEFGGKPALVAHGDGLGKGDIKYRMLKKVLRSKVAVWGFRAIHPEIGMRIARRVSSTDEKLHRDHSSSTRAEFLEHWAREQLAADASLGFVLCGHSHVPVLMEISPGRYYINSGDWIKHRTYVTVDADGKPLMLNYDS